MKSGLLESQFNTLEVPDYALHVDISKPRSEVLNAIISKLRPDE
jgi:gluconate kinase